MTSPLKNWRKQVTVFPAAGVQFNLDPTENKPLTFLTIKKCFRFSNSIQSKNNYASELPCQTKSRSNKSTI